MNPCNYKGTDVNYTTLCHRRGWLSVNDMYITSESDFVKDGKFLSEKNRSIGFKHITIGRNTLDNLEIDGNNYIVHEFKRGHRVLEADILQTAHYIYCLEKSLSINASGAIHLLSSKSIYTVILTPDLKNKLKKTYRLIESFRKINIPSPKRIHLCFHGCSYRDFCWG
ncbi:MAG: Dna2/Cas4 domain-containing protein [Thermoplasmata archaeon]